MASSKKQVRLGGRTERNRMAVANAVLQLLQDGNINFEIQEVALLSGVHRTTIYRRWPERAELIKEALGENALRLSVEFSGNWKADLREIAFVMRNWLVEPVQQGINRLVASTDNEELLDTTMSNWLPIFERLQQPIVLGQSRGEIDKDVDSRMIILTITSTLLTTIMLQRLYPDDDFVERLVAQLIHGITEIKPSTVRRKTKSKTG